VSTSHSEPEIVSFRLSPQQEHLRTLHGGGVCAAIAVLEGPIAESAVRAALTEVVQLHEILRTTIVTPAGMRAPQQVVHEQLAPGWASEDADVDALLSDRAALADVLAREAGRGVDIEQGPLIRGLALGLGGERSLLVLTAAAAAADGASMLILLDEVARLVGGHDLPTEPIQYADYAEWRHEQISGDDADAQEGRQHWQERAADLPPAPPRLLFGSLERPAVSPSAAVPIALTADGLERLRRAADAAGVSVAAFLEASWHALIGRLAGTGEIVLTHWVDGRSQPDLAGAVGCYAQPVAIRSRCEADTSFAEILDQLRRAGTQATRWQDHSSAGDLSDATRLAPIGFAHLDADAGDPRTVDIALLRQPLAGHPLALCCFAHRSALELELRHDPAAYDADDAREIAACFATLLSSAVAEPSAPACRLALIGTDERASLLAAAVGPSAGADAATPVHHGFEAQARLTPERVAVRSAAGVVSYAELNAAANRLAHHLRDAGVGPGVAVGLCMDRTAAMLTALLGILKAGGAYLPLNYEHPPARLAEQLARANAPLTVTAEALRDRLASFAGAVVSVDGDAEAIAACPDGNPDHLAGPADLVYIMYTSGSTGLPKGVEVTHGNLANYTSFMVARLGADDAARADGLACAVVSAISTDLGNTTIFPTLVAGGAVHLVDPQAVMDGDAFASWADDHPLDVLKITPSHLRALLGGSRPAAVLPRQWLVLGGEALSWELVAQIRGLAPALRIINHYGPTETTVGCATHDVESSERADSATVPIGRPIAGSRIHVLDAVMEPVPAGVPGELYVGGAGAARGYVGSPEQTAERFVVDPFASDPRERLYRTGDRARRLRDGAIEFLGRVDDQVKIRGFRIEPGEIEAVLGRHPAIRQAAVAAVDADGGERRLVAYLVASQEPSVEELQAFLAESLPDYMVPSSFATLDALPFTPSGKIDRTALAGLVAVQTRREAQFVAPRDPLEQEIAGIWGELLGIERVGVFDDFFALGGHSLLATQAIIRIRRTHGEIPLRALLAAPTVATLAEVVRSASAASTAGGGPA
jgi:amino acid adenylation domain-containing protein